VLNLRLLKSGSAITATERRPPMEIQSSAGRGRLQEPCGAPERVRVLYGEQVLDHLSPTIRRFLTRQGMVFIATADSRGECDCSFWTGSPGFVRTLDNETLAYAEYRGTGVRNSLRNLSENPHIGMLFVDRLGARRFCTYMEEPGSSRPERL
jgi:hypothetical protein